MNFFERMMVAMFVAIIILGPLYWIGNTFHIEWINHFFTPTNGSVVQQ